MVNNNVSNTDRLKSGLSYIPLWWAVIYFLEKDKSPYLMKHIKYWTFLFIIYLLVRVVLWWLWLPIGWLLVIFYLWLAIYLWMKAYKWEDIDIEVIDSFYANNFKWNQNSSNVKNNEEVKEEVVNKDEGEAVIKTNNIVVDKIANGFTKIIKDVKKDEKDEFYEESNETDEVTIEEEQKKETKKDEDILNF